jgi:hypothetical protein
MSSCNGKRKLRFLIKKNKTKRNSSKQHIKKIVRNAVQLTNIRAQKNVLLIKLFLHLNHLLGTYISLTNVEEY